LSWAGSAVEHQRDVRARDGEADGVIALPPQLVVAEDVAEQA